MSLVSTPSPATVLALQLVRLVRTQGLAGVAYWREMFQIAQVDEASLRAALQQAAPAVDVPDLRGPMVMATSADEDADFFVKDAHTAHLPERVRWEATPYTVTLAGEAMCFGESLRESLRTTPTLSPWQQLERAQCEAIVRWSTAQQRCGVSVPDIARQWPVFDPAAGFSDSLFERQIAESWLRHQGPQRTPSLPDEADRMMLAMALHLHQAHPTRAFADLVDQSCSVSRQMTSRETVSRAVAAPGATVPIALTVDTPSVQPPSA